MATRAVMLTVSEHKRAYFLWRSTQQPAAPPPLFFCCRHSFLSSPFLLLHFFCSPQLFLLSSPQRMLLVPPSPESPLPPLPFHQRSVSHYPLQSALCLSQKTQNLNKHSLWLPPPQLPAPTPLPLRCLLYPPSSASSGSHNH